MSEPLLSVRDLRVGFRTDDGVVQAVDGVSFDVEAGQTIGIVGESGSGKSVSNLTILGLTRADDPEISGSIKFEGQELIDLDDEGLRSIRGDDIAMIFQDPLTSLHPFYKVGDQLTEAIQTHREMTTAQARSHATDLLGLVGIPDASRRFDEYPHEFSGGMRQRAMIAMALTNDPKLLIADEPTTALDVTIQAQILRLLARLQSELGMAMILITHDLGVVVEVASEILVLYGGRVVERGTLEEIFYDPQHPYTWGLLGSVARVDGTRSDRLTQIAGQPPSLISPPEGCHFRPRCPHEFAQCTMVPPLEARAGGEHLDRCWLDVQKKRELRTLDSGEIGLPEKQEAEAS
ncbi:MAG: ABC transporter ATP-binding protein [Actinomycetota bacterium]|nr:ABC transporter ATP-binding protein [Actinomycetota bacterium]